MDAAYPHDREPITLEGKAAGRAAGMLIARKKVAAEPVAHKLEIRAQILRDMSWAVGQGGPGIPALREANVKMAAEAQTWGNVPPFNPHTMYRATCKCGWRGVWHSYKENVESRCPDA